MSEGRKWLVGLALAVVFLSSCVTVAAGLSALYEIVTAAPRGVMDGSL